MNILKKIINQKGQTLVEVMVALSIAIVIVSAIVVSIINALNNEKFGVNQNQATQLAQGGVDLFRDLSQSNWATFTTYGDTTTDGKTWCLPQSNPTPGDSSLGCNPNAGTNLNFVREINVELNVCVTPTPDVYNSARVTSIVKWADGKCTGTGDDQYCHQTKIISCMFKPFINSSP